MFCWYLLSWSDPQQQESDLQFFQWNADVLEGELIAVVSLDADKGGIFAFVQVNVDNIFPRLTAERFVCFCFFTFQFIKKIVNE